MAMKLSSKFERMKMKPSQAMAPKPSMPTGSMSAPAGEAGGQALPAKLRPMVDPKVKARREAMRKAGQKMGPMK